MRSICCTWIRWQLSDMRWVVPCSLLFSCFVHAQELAVPTPPWNVGTRAHYGFLWPHRPAAWYLVQGHASAFEVYGERRFKNDRSWQRLYKGASYGVGILYSGMADPDIIGGGIRLIPYMHIPFIQGDRGSFGMRLGWGIGYIFKSFDRVDNYKQIATGSRLNTAIQLMFEYRMQIDRFRLSTGLSIDHWSNGSFVLPNLGLNLLSLNTGVAYALHNPVRPTEAPDTSVHQLSPREISIVGSFGFSEVAKPLSGQYSVYSLVAQIQWNVTPKSSFAVGLDVFNKGSLRTIHAELAYEPRLAYTQLGAHAGWALGFGRGELVLQMGAYAYSPYPDESPVFHRLGMRYRAGERLMLHVGLKSHWAVADHWEWGVGYRWH